MRVFFVLLASSFLSICFAQLPQYKIKKLSADSLKQVKGYKQFNSYSTSEDTNSQVLRFEPLFPNPF